MLRVAAHLFRLPDVDFTMSFGDNQCCDRRERAPYVLHTLQRNV